MMQYSSYIAAYYEIHGRDLEWVKLTSNLTFHIARSFDSNENLILIEICGFNFAIKFEVHEVGLKRVKYELAQFLKFCFESDLKITHFYHNLSLMTKQR